MPWLDGPATRSSSHGAATLAAVSDGAFTRVEVPKCYTDPGDGSSSPGHAGERRMASQKLLWNCPGGNCQMPWLSVMGTSSFATQVPKPKLCSAETPGDVVFSSSEL